MAIGEAKEVSKARRDVADKDAAVWNDRAAAGRTARETEGAQKQGTRSEEAPKGKAKPRQGPSPG